MKKRNLNQIVFVLFFLFFVMACQAVTGLPSQTSPTVQEETTSYGWSDMSPAPDKFSLIKITGNDANLGDVLRAEAHKATELGRDPYVDFYADWCPPCRAIEANIADERMIDAFSGTYIIQLDFDEWEDELSDTGFYVIGIPSYYEIDGEGYSTGRMITGAAWGEDIPENIAPPMKAFFVGE